MSRESIRQELLHIKNDIDFQIQALGIEAKRRGVEPVHMLSMQGDFMLTPLLVAKANVLLALSNLETR